MSLERVGRIRTAAKTPVGQMRVKRSVSPDGRIDSLSVEITSPLDILDPEDLARRAREIVAGEAKVVEVFLGKERSEPAARPDEHGRGPAEAGTKTNGNGKLERARMLAIRGIDTEWGRRLFLTVKVNGNDVRLFGKRRIAAALADAGTPLEESVLEEGLELDLPCQVVVGRTPDGRYPTIEKILPASAT